MARLTVLETGSANVLAFLDMLGWSENGPALLAASDDGYNVIVGSTAAHPHLFQSYADHPQVFVSLNDHLRSSAAGRYQFLAKTWDALANQYHYTDFSPPNQDRGAINLLHQCGAYWKVVGGDIKRGIAAAAPIWASLPGAGYGQPEHGLDTLMGVYSAALAGYMKPDFGNVAGGSAP